MIVPDSKKMTWTDSWGRTFSVESLVLGWSVRVRGIADGATRQDDDSYNADDYTGALFARDRIAAALSQMTTDDRTEIETEVHAIDDRFASITELDEGGKVAERGDVVPDPDAWWWRRIPVSGSIREEFDG